MLHISLLKFSICSYIFTFSPRAFNILIIGILKLLSDIWVISVSGSGGCFIL
jgi:hypothetical protein